MHAAFLRPSPQRPALALRYIGPQLFTCCPGTGHAAVAHALTTHHSNIVILQLTTWQYLNHNSIDIGLTCCCCRYCHPQASGGYCEPPRILGPTRQCLGWLLLQLHRLPQAADVFLADLEQFPGNAWALTGLQQLLEAAATAVAPAPADATAASLVAGGQDALLGRAQGKHVEPLGGRRAAAAAAAAAAEGLLVEPEPDWLLRVQAALQQQQQERFGSQILPVPSSCPAFSQ